ncbi:gp04 [Burkholderia phage Bcep1]|uniref:Gp04 n=1 Tax=Burkholderia phage Bcep1 TaxID=2883943 RepID=Q6UJ28_9CAUD|nr:gp04 [Burkholderia phage Bcep1]AAQ73350.1 gp04 [Burkholderia phage Bcep1]
MPTTTIPIDQIVQMLPGVIGAGGAPGRLTGLVLTQDTSVQPGQLADFFQKTDVENWFGALSNEAKIADAYFPGIVNGGQLPYDLKFARYVAADAPASVYGIPLTGITLAQLQGYSGTLTVTTAAQHVSANISLAAATSFANAATLIEAAFTSPDFVVAYDALRNRFTVVTNTTGTAAAISAVTGTNNLADELGLSAAAGATLQAAGVAADTPASAMNRAVGLSRNWATFTTAWTAVIADRLAFAAWNSGQAYKYMYVAPDLEAASIVTNNAASFGAQVFAAPYQGTLPLYGDQATAGAVMGYAASINFQLRNGRTVLAFRQFNAGVPATAHDLPTANALRSNNYTYIGAYANAANNYTIAYDGKLSGKFLWVDTYLDQIYLNAELQRAEFEAMLAYNSLPYNEDGYTANYRAGVDVIDAAVTSGIIRAGVTLTNSQLQQIDAVAGVAGAGALVQTRGWYFLIGNPANPGQARQNRTSPACTLWYSDGGSIQELTIGSNAVI